MTITELAERAHAFLAGRALSFNDADQLWKGLKIGDEISLARRVLERMRQGRGLIDGLPADRKKRLQLCQQEALLTSKDSEVIATRRHDRGLTILTDVFGDLDDPALDTDTETLGIAGGILKRRWNDLGQLEDLRRAARFYEPWCGRGYGRGHLRAHQRRVHRRSTRPRR